jgi:hypothetical protein
VEKGSLDRLCGVMIVWWNRRVLKILCKYLEIPSESDLAVESFGKHPIHETFYRYGWSSWWGGHTAHVGYQLIGLGTTKRGTSFKTYRMFMVDVGGWLYPFLMVMAL